MAKRKAPNGIRYSDRQKSAAVESVKAAGGKVTDQILADVRLLVNSPTLSFNSLNNWVKTAKKTARIAARESTSFNSSLSGVDAEDFNPQATAAEMWKATRVNYLKRANTRSAIDDTDGKEAVMAAERAQKMEQLLQGLPTEILGAIPLLTEIYQFLKESGQDFNDAQRQFLAAMRAAKQNASMEDEQ